ncbi:hypothetical protein DC522_33930 [Microvirga sp. KLBC 81]|nr:hypothetical protein DC522_33930 [Microvirga sp. KLBC 81]
MRAAHQHDVCGLHEQGPQVFVSAMRELGAGELDPQHDGAALILSDKEAVLAQSDAQGGQGGRGRRP